ncbi:universal stress protein [Mariniflexile soesokkakense]|uniref:Universal stress protein n=1 Tax=Mariniflexile soesokkakense TaxID=1343160 RepID=A0ABV0A6W3_9FLAO
MRKILIPTDFSENATNALEYAIALFKYEISEFFIMHAYQDDIYAEDLKVTRETLSDVTEMVGNRSKIRLESIKQHAYKILPNPRHTYHIVSSNNILVDEADKIVDKENIDVIVMGTRGYTNDSKITFGSHTLQVLKYVSCPVLVIPEKYKYKKPLHILFPTNYLIPYKRRELKLLCEMVCPYNALIDILYITSSRGLSMRQQDNQDFIKNELCKNDLNFKTVNSKNITNTINSYIKENSVDMLVMVNNRHTFLEDILMQSTIDKMGLYINIPFCVLQNIHRDI